MDSNYEAQKQLTNQRLAARREQAAAERMLREGRPARMGGFKQFLLALFRRSRRPEKHTGAQKSPSARVAISGKAKQQTD